MTRSLPPTAPMSGTAPPLAPGDAPIGIPGRPGTRAECDVMAARLAAISDRLRGEVQAGMPPERYAVAHTCVAALDAALSLVDAMRLSLGPDAAHAPSAPKR